MSTNLKMLIAEFGRFQHEENKKQIPKHLKQKVVELCEQYTLEEIANYLGLKKWTIRQWQRRSDVTKQSVPSKSLDFVTIAPTKESKVEAYVSAATIRIELSHGIKLFIDGQNKAELVELASDLAKRLIA